MMKLNLTKILPVFTIAFMSSCTTMLYTNLDVLRPAKVTFDTATNNLLIVNNTVKQPDDYGHKTEFYNERSKNIVQKADSLPIYCLSVTYEEIGNSDFFNDVKLHSNSINPSKDFFTIYPLTPDTVNALCRRYNCNVVLSLDRLKVNDKIAELFNDIDYSYYTALVARYESQWSIHYPEKDKFSSINFRDTVYWDAESFQRKKALEALPERSNALIDGALYVGQNAFKKFIPRWEKTDRYLFSTTNKNLKQGMDSFYLKNWKAAIDIWDKAIDKSGLSLKAKLANNIAVAYEISGNINKANEYAIKSLEYFQSEPIVNDKHLIIVINYTNELSRRIKEIEMINKQLGN